MTLSSGLKDRGIQLLLLVVVLNVLAYVLLWSLDLYVNTDLYDYGLEFSYDWAANYWYNNGMGWGLLASSTALASLSLIPHYIYIKEHSRFSKGVGFLLPTVAIVYQVLGIFFLFEVNNIVKNQLYDFGLKPNYTWISTVNDFNLAIMILMIIALLALIISTIRILDLIKME